MNVSPNKDAIPTASRNNRRYLRVVIASSCVVLGTLAASQVPLHADSNKASDAATVRVADTLSPETSQSDSAKVRVSLSDSGNNSNVATSDSAKPTGPTKDRLPELYKSPASSAKSTVEQVVAPKLDVLEEDQKIVAVEPPLLSKPPQLYKPIPQIPRLASAPTPRPVEAVKLPPSEMEFSTEDPAVPTPSVPVAKSFVPEVKEEVPSAETAEDEGLLLDEMPQLAEELAADEPVINEEIPLNELAEGPVGAPQLLATSVSGQANPFVTDASLSTRLLANEPIKVSPVPKASYIAIPQQAPFAGPTPTFATEDPAPTPLPPADINIKRRKMAAKTYEKLIAKVASSNEAICKTFLIDSRNIALLGTADGRATVKIDFVDGTSVESTIEVRSNVLQGEPVSDNQKLATLTASLREIYPKAAIELLPSTNGSVVVKGQLPSETDARDVMVLVRQVFLVPIEDKLVVGPR